MQGYQKGLLFFALFITVTYAQTDPESAIAASDTVIRYNDLIAGATDVKLVNIFCSFLIHVHIYL